MLKNQENSAKIPLLMIIILKHARKDAERKLREAGLSQLQFGVLKLVSTGNNTAAELAKNMMLEPATLVPVIDILEKKKYLKRQPDAKDRRKNLLSLTDTGSKKISKIKLASKNSAFSKTLARFGKGQSEKLLSLLEELVKLTKPDLKFVNKINQLIR